MDTGQCKGNSSPLHCVESTLSAEHETPVQCMFSQSFSKGSRNMERGWRVSQPEVRYELTVSTALSACIVQDFITFEKTVSEIL